MKKILIIFFILASSVSFAGTFDDIDYNFIQHAFEGTKAVSDEDFQKAINSKTPQPVGDGFGAKLKTFLFGRKYGVDTVQPKSEEKIDPISEAQIIQETKNGIYFIKLIAPVISLDNQVIPAGNYKIKQEDIQGQPRLIFYQGHQKYGELKLYKYNDPNKKEHDLTYSRVDIVSDDYLRIIYATIDDTKCAVAKVYNGL